MNDDRKADSDRHDAAWDDDEEAPATRPKDKAPPETRPAYRPRRAGRYRPMNNARRRERR